MPQRRFPPPWSVVEELDSCFVVKDANGQALAYMYFEKELLRRFRRFWLAQQLRQLCKNGGDPLGFVAREQLATRRGPGSSKSSAIEVLSPGFPGRANSNFEKINAVLRAFYHLRER